MANVLDVAKFILEQHGKMTTMKLQKLVYYSQAWSLAWSDELLFDEKIRAWKQGSVVGVLHHVHKGWLNIEAGHLHDASSSRLSDVQRETISAVLSFYGKWTPDELSDLSHQESPWIDARGTMPSDAYGDVEITRDAMREFYRTIAGTRDAPHSPHLLRHLAEGIEDARAGRVGPPISFAQYLED